MEPDPDKRSKAGGDLATAIVLLAAAGAGYWSLAHNKAVEEFDYGADPGPGLLPEILLILLAACALALAVGAVWRLIAARALPPTAPAKISWRIWAIPSLLTLTLVAYVVGTVSVGFMPATLAFTALWILLLGIRERGRLSVRDSLLFAVQAAAIVIGIYLLFAKLIGVPLP